MGVTTSGLCISTDVFHRMRLQLFGYYLVAPGSGTPAGSYVDLRWPAADGILYLSVGV